MSLQNSHTALNCELVSQSRSQFWLYEQNTLCFIQPALKSLILLYPTTCCGNLFLQFTALWLQLNFLRSYLLLLSLNFKLCPLVFLLFSLKQTSLSISSLSCSILKISILLLLNILVSNVVSFNY